MKFSLLLVFCGAAFAASTGSPQNAMKTPENMMQVPRNATHTPMNATQATKNATQAPTNARQALMNATQATKNLTATQATKTATKAPTPLPKLGDLPLILAKLIEEAEVNQTKEIGKLRGLVAGLQNSNDRLEGNVSELQDSNDRLKSEMNLLRDEHNHSSCDANWKSGRNTNGCKEYTVNKYCKMDGDHYGSKWDITRWGTMEDWADSRGRTALVCPHCGCKDTGVKLACITRHTAWEVALSKSLEFLDRHNVKCGPGEVLGRLQFRRKAKDYPIVNKFWGYEYECCVVY